MKILRTFFLFSSLTFSFSAELFAAVLSIDSQKVLEIANAKNISESRGWKKLLHIEPNMFGLKSRQISDPNFYLSNSPEYQNRTELEATLLAFSEPAENYARLIEHPLKKNITGKFMDHSQHAICRFPARLKFLKAELPDLKEYWQSLPQVSCLYQNIFLEAIDAESISFVFSSYYSDSPGSAFGHTFFRINRKFNQTKSRQELLDYGVGFAANVTVTNQALYAVLGLVGGFTGSWSNLPYYYKVREYNNFEARDLWSYDLNLKPDEVQMLADHLWEIGPHFYTYYFFTQNCAFHMLTMLEAAAPRLHLIEHVPFYYVIPSDSMKALFYEQDLVKNVSFRPSIRKVFLERVNRLEKQSYMALAKYSSTEDSSDSDQLGSVAEKALFLDAAMDLVDLRNPNLSAEKNPDTFERKNQLLKKRAALDYITPELSLKTLEQEHPEGSHGSSRVGLSYQEKSNLKSGNFEYRFALHDLQDPQVGLPQNSQLEFFNFKFSLLPGELKFEEMNLFKVLNLNPINFFETKASWGVELGVQNKKPYCEAHDRDCFLNGALVKVGAAKNIFSESLLIWAMGSLNLRYGPTLLDSKFYTAPGFEVGLLFRFNFETSFMSRFSREYPLDRGIYEQNYEAELRHSIYKDNSFGLRIKNDYYGVAAYFYY